MRTLFLKTCLTSISLAAAFGTAQASTLVHEVGGEVGSVVHAEHAVTTKSRSAVTQELMQLRAKMPRWNQQLMGSPVESGPGVQRTREAVAQEARSAVAAGQIASGEAN